VFRMMEVRCECCCGAHMSISLYYIHVNGMVGPHVIWVRLLGLNVVVGPTCVKGLGLYA
jgi:hypothetical protein